MASQISLLMENQPGALSRVIGLFSQRGHNIDSLSVAPTQDPTLSRLTMTTSESTEVIQQILKQLYKLIDVVMVQDLKASESISLEMALIKVSNKSEVISKIDKISEEKRRKVEKESKKLFSRKNVFYVSSISGSGLEKITQSIGNRLANENNKS